MLKESLQPTITNALLEWNLPNGYLLADTTPKMFHSMYVGNSYTAFAFLQRELHEDVVCEHSCAGSATISGVVGKDVIQVLMKPTSTFHFDPEQEPKVTELLLQHAIWSKLVDLEQQALSISYMSGKNTYAVPEKPSSKRVCLSGSIGHCSNDADISVIRKQLLDISLQSHILSPLTYLTSENSSLRILQILPYEIHTGYDCASVCVRHKARHYRRKYHHHHHRFTPSRQASFSFGNIAKSTISSVSSHLKSVFGLFLPDTNLVPANDIQMLEDEVEYQEKKGSQLQLDSSFNLIYPPCYYSTQGAYFSSTNKELTGQMDSSTADGKPIQLHRTSVTSVMSKHSGDEVDISDNESDSSLDPDWDGLKQPNDLLPLIHMQLFSGAWPLVKPFSYAVGVPLNEIRKLPVIIDKYRVSSNAPCSTEDMKEEEKGNFWCTVLAVTCLEECFAHLFTEWELVAYKGKIWLEQNQHQCDLTLNETYHIARKLVLKQSKL